MVSLQSDQCKNPLPNLEDHLNGEDPGEDVVKVVEDVVALGVLSHRVLRRQSHAAGADDDHDEQVKVAQVHHKVTESPNAETRRDENHW